MQKSGKNIEIERKFLIRYPDTAWLAAQPGARSASLSQIYLTSEKGESRRVRQWEENGKIIWFQTRKQTLTDRSRIEEESVISREEYLSLLGQADPERNPVIKNRWCIPYEGHVLEIDLYPFWKKQAVLEIELDREEEAFSIPPELTVLREVTGDPQYLNSSLARSIPVEII